MTRCPVFHGCLHFGSSPVGSGGWNFPLWESGFTPALSGGSVQAPTACVPGASSAVSTEGSGWTWSMSTWAVLPWRSVASVLV